MHLEGQDCLQFDFWSNDVQLIWLNIQVLQTALQGTELCLVCLQCGEPVSVSIAASFLTKTSALQSFVDQMPDWVASSAMTTFQSSWTFNPAGHSDTTYSSNRSEDCRIASA